MFLLILSLINFFVIFILKFILVARSLFWPIFHNFFTCDVKSLEITLAYLTVIY